MKINTWLFVAFVSYQADRKMHEVQAARSSSSYKTTRLSAAKAPYDKSARFFSPDGELMQLSYADQAGENGESLICLVTAEQSIVLVCPSLSSSSSQLLDRRCVDKISRIEDGIWIATAGLLGDTRHLVREARIFCVDQRKKFGARATVKSVASYVGRLQYESTLQGAVRPLGVHVITCGFDESLKKKTSARTGGGNSPVVYLSRASGDVIEWKATAIGKGRAKVLRMLEDNIPRPDEEMPSESDAALQAKSILQRIASHRNLDHQEDAGVKKSKTSTRVGGDIHETNRSSSSSPSSSSSTTDSTATVLASADTVISTTDDDDACNRYDVYVLKRSSTDTDTNQQRYHVERTTI